jgi:CelD/BcsL family acetyltransferase involved in cellulose biosynthesis
MSRLALAARSLTRLLPVSELTALDLHNWSDLAARAVEPNPFFEPEIALPAARRLEDDPVLLVAEGPDGWMACLPVIGARLMRLVPTLRTWTYLYCFLGTPLLDARDPGEAARALIDCGRDRSRLLLLERVADDGPAGEALREAADELDTTPVFETSYERAFLRRRPDGDYLSGMRSHRRRELNRLGRRMAAELGGEISVVDEAGDDRALDAFLELERSGWKGLRGTAMDSGVGHADFFREVCRAMAENGRLELLTLRVGDRRVAMKCNFFAGEGAFCFKIAFDDELARFSPGVQLERENVRIFHERGAVEWEDSCADPANAMINRLWPDRRRISATVLSPAGLRAGVTRQGAHLAQGLRQRNRRSS